MADIAVNFRRPFDGSFNVPALGITDKLFNVVRKVHSLKMHAERRRSGYLCLGLVRLLSISVAASPCTNADGRSHAHGANRIRGVTIRLCRVCALAAVGRAGSAVHQGGDRGSPNVAEVLIAGHRASRTKGGLTV